MPDLEKDMEMDVQKESTESSSEHHSHHHSHHSHHRHHSHHHHHHHHSHSHRSKPKQERKRRAFKQFLRKNRKKIALICIAVLFCVCSIVAGLFMDNLIHRNDDSQTNGIAFTEGQLSVSVSVFDQPVEVTNTATRALLASPAGNVSDLYKQYRGFEMRLDRGLPMTLSYSVNAAPKGYVVAKAVFSVADNQQLTDPMRLAPAAGKESVECVNLKTGTTYYYRLDLTFTNGVQSAVLGSFKTKAGPRMITVDGGYNMRDVGGWKTADGRQIKQGLLYRGCELDGATKPQYLLTEVGKNTMLTQLRIKTELDMRSKTDTTKDALGATVKHVYYDAPMYTTTFVEGHNENIRRLFADLANPAIYPAYIHCAYGQDRTGTMIYLLGALLGMNETDMLTDYNLSGLYHGVVSTDEMNAFVRRVNELPGDTLAQKVEGYLKSVGVTDGEIQSIRSIFLEDVQ